MSARIVNQAADVIHRAQVNGAQTAAGLAIALESARLLVSDEMVHQMAALEAERDALKARVDEVERKYTFDVAELRRERDRVQERLNAAALVKVWKNEDGKRFVFAEDLTVALLGPERKAAPAGGDVTPQVAKLRSLLAGQREAVDGEHYAAVHHTYRVPRDLPPLDGAR